MLEPGLAIDTHPYPVELDLPMWCIERDVVPRIWLFGIGAGICIEGPEALKGEQKL